MRPTTPPKAEPSATGSRPRTSSSRRKAAARRPRPDPPMRRSGLESFVAGAAFAAVATVTVYATAAAFGLSPRPALYVLGAGVVAAAVAGVTSRSRPEALPFRGGGLAAGTAALLLDGAVGGRFGALPVPAAAVSVAVAVVGPALGRLVDPPVPKWLAVVGAAAVALVLGGVEIGGGELGHDE